MNLFLSWVLLPEALQSLPTSAPSPLPFHFPTPLGKNLTCWGSCFKDKYFCFWLKEYSGSSLSGPEDKSKAKETGKKCRDMSC